MTCIFSCAGYSDLLDGINFDLFITLESSIEELSLGAKQLLKVIERLEVTNMSASKKKSLAEMN